MASIYPIGYHMHPVIWSLEKRANSITFTAGVTYLGWVVGVVWMYCRDINVFLLATD